MKTTDILFKEIENLKEGWAIYWATGTEDEGWRIEANDHENRLTDKQAIRLVYDMAKKGSKVHLDTLEFMRANASATENLFIIECILK